MGILACDVRPSGGAFLAFGGIGILACDVQPSGGAFLPLPRPHMILEEKTDKNVCPTTGRNACATEEFSEPSSSSTHATRLPETLWSGRSGSGLPRRHDLPA